MGEFANDRKGKAMLTRAEKCELLATVHEEFDRPDMALERRREARCTTLVELNAVHGIREESMEKREPELPPHTADAPPERHRGADRA